MRAVKTIEEIRHENLLRLLKEFEDAGVRGPIQALADKLEKSHAQVSQWKTRAKRSDSGKPSNIDSDSARFIEERCRKPRGWMDHDHGPDALTPAVLEMAQRLQHMPDDVESLVDALMRISDPQLRGDAVARAYFAAFRLPRREPPPPATEPMPAPAPAPEVPR